MERSELLLNDKPPIQAWMHHALSLSMASIVSGFYPWFYSNYIQLFAQHSEEGLKIDYIVKEIPFIEERAVMPVFAGKIPNDLYGLLEKSINDGWCIILYLDECYIPVKHMFAMKTFVYPNLLYGYDVQQQLFSSLGLIKGKTKISRFKISYSELAASFEHSTNRLIRMIHPKETSGITFNKSRMVNQLREYLSADTSGDNRNNVLFGQGVYEAFKRSIESAVEKENDDIDDRLFYFLVEHKKVMSDRIDYLMQQAMLNEDEAHRLSHRYKEIVNLSETAMWLMFKNNEMQNFIKKDYTLVRKILATLDEIVEKENIILGDMLSRLAH